MNIPVLTFFNNKGGVGKTTLVYHLSWMFAEMGRSVVTLDLDPQANLTTAFLDEDQLESTIRNRAKMTAIPGNDAPVLQGVPAAASSIGPFSSPSAGSTPGFGTAALGPFDTATGRPS